MQIVDIYSQLLRDEGFVSHVYPDSKGIPTIGIGHNLRAKPLPWLGGAAIITMAQAMDILHTDVNDVLRGLGQEIPWYTDLDVPRQGVLINMGFNMGDPALLKFHITLSDLQAKNYIKTADDMKQSKWYGDVGKRAVRLCEQMRTGVWQ